MPTIEEMISLQKKYELSLTPELKLHNLIEYLKDKYKIEDKLINELEELIQQTREQNEL